MIKNFLLMLFCAAAAAQDQSGQWQPTGALSNPRRDACLASLPDGRVLATGGIGVDGTLHGTEIYTDPSFQPAAPMMAARSSHTCTVLGDGRVLVVGGREGDEAVSGAEIFDPTSGSWSPAGNVPLPRWGHTATLLPDGSVLIAGGENEAGPSAVLERFDPIANTFTTLTSTLATPRTLHIAAALPNGRVLIAGGRNSDTDLDSTELVDPFGDQVMPGPTLPEPRSAASAASVVDGRVLLVGGSSGGTDLASTLIFDPAASSFTAGPSLQVARAASQAISIPHNGNILVIGGTARGVPTASTEFYDAVGNQFMSFGDLTLAREGLAVAPIGTSGAILAAGGAINGVPIAACGKTTTPVTFTSDKTIYVVGERATLTATWAIRKENVTVAVQLTSTTGTVTTQIIPTANETGAFTVTTNPLTGPSTAVVTAVGAVTGLTLTLSFQVDVTSTLSFLPPSPIPPALIKVPVIITALLHPSANAAFGGNVTLFDGSTLIGNVSNFDTANFHIDSGDGIATFHLPNGFSTSGVHNLTAQFQGLSIGFVASSATPAPLAYSVERRTTSLRVVVKEPPPRIRNLFNFLITASPSFGVPLPTGFVSISEGANTLARVPLTQPSSFTFNPSSLVDVQIVSGVVPGPRTFVIAYEGDSNYAPRTLTHIEEMLGLIPNLRVNSVTPQSPDTALTVDHPANVSITFTPVPGVDPWASTVCPAPQCSFDIKISPVPQQNGVGFSEASLQNIFPPAPDTNGAPVTVTASIIPRLVGPGTVSPKLSCIVAPGGIPPFQNLRTNYDCFTSSPFPFTVTKKGTGDFTLSAVGTALPTRTAKITVDPGIHALSGTFQLVEGTNLLQSTNIAPSATASTTLSSAPTFSFTVNTSAGSHTYSVLYSGDANYNPFSATVTVSVP